MDITVRKLPKSQAEITVRLPWDEWKEEIGHAVEYLGKDLKLPGFRPGKIPRDVLEQRLGKKAILTEAAEHSVGHSYPRALEERKIEAIGYPEVKLGTVTEGEVLAYTVVTAVMPEVRIASFEKEIRNVNRVFVEKSVEVSEEELEGELKRLAAMRAPIVTVDRAARTGDIALVDFTVTQNGALTENGTGTNHPVELGKGAFIPGFEEALVGMNAGEEKTFSLSFPSEYYVKHLAGKPADFSVKIRAVQERRVSVVDDDFAKNAGRFASLAELKERLKTGMTEEKKTKQQEARRTEILEILADRADIDFPDILISEESDRMFREFRANIQMTGMNFDEYLARSGKTEANLKTEWQSQARKRVAAHLVLSELAKRENIVVENGSIEEEMNKALQYYKNVKDAEKNIDMRHLYGAAKERLTNEKVFEFLEKL